MKDLSVGSPTKQILTFTIPMLIGHGFQQMYNIVDTIILGKFIGTEAVAAAGASFPVIFVLVSLVIGITTGITVVISQYFGAKDYQKVKRAIDTATIFLFFGSILLTVLGLIFIKPIWNLLSLPENLVESATIYFNVYAIGLVFMFGYNGIGAVLRGLGDSKTPLYFLIIATLLNIVLDLVFVLVFKWGIAGVAIATVVSQAVAFALCVIYLNRYHKLIRISHSGLVFDKAIFLKSVKIGLPSGIQHTFVALGMMGLMRIVNEFGTITIAGYSIAGRIDSFAALPAMSFSAALSVFVGQNIGANKSERIKQGYRSTLIMTSIYSVTISIIAWFFGRELMGLFTNDPQVIEVGYEYLVIVSSFYIFFSAMFANHGLLRGAGDTLVPMFITIFALWVLRIPISYFLSQKLGTVGIWWGVPIAWIFSWLVTHLYYLSGKWKGKAVVKHEDKP